MREEVISEIRKSYYNRYKHLFNQIYDLLNINLPYWLIDFRILLFEILIYNYFQVAMKRVRCHYRAASDSCRLRGVRSFIKLDLSLQSNVRSCEDLSSNKPIDATVVKPLLALQSSWSRRSNFKNGDYYLYPFSSVWLAHAHKFQLRGDCRKQHITLCKFTVENFDICF